MVFLYTGLVVLWIFTYAEGTARRENPVRADAGSISAGALFLALIFSEVGIGLGLQLIGVGWLFVNTQALLLSMLVALWRDLDGNRRRDVYAPEGVLARWVDAHYRRTPLRLLALGGLYLRAALRAPRDS